MALPIPNLDNQSFEQLVEEAKRLIPVHAPDCTDHNLHDPGITFIELFAWLAEMQQYSLDRISDRHRLKYLKLLGTKPRPPQSAVLDVTFSGHGSVAAGTKLTGTGSSGEEIVFQIDQALEVLPVDEKTLAKIYVQTPSSQFKDVLDFAAQNHSYFYAFGEEPRPEAVFYLGFRELPGEKTLTVKVRLSDLDLIPLGEHDTEASALVPTTVVEWQVFRNRPEPPEPVGSSPAPDSLPDWYSLTVDTDNTAMFNRSGTLALKIPQGIVAATAKDVGINAPGEHPEVLFWLRCKVVTAGWEIPPRIERLLLNTVAASEGESIRDEELGESNGFPNQVFTVKRRPLAEQNPKVAVKVDSAIWEEVADLDASGPADRHFMVDYINGKLTFGDGIHGRIPAVGAQVMVTYRTCNGELGNIQESVLKEVEGHLLIGANNLFPAFGGKRGESIAEAFVRARKELRVQFSAVTLQDLETIAKATPGLRVARAQAIAGERGMTVVVVPFSLSAHAQPSPGFLKAVWRHLDRHRLITTELAVTGPQYVEVAVSAVVKAKPGYRPHEVSSRCIQKLNAFLAPLECEGSAGWPFGRTVFRSEVYAVLDEVEGVDGITAVSLQAAAGDGFAGDDRGNIQIVKTAVVYPGSHNIEVSLLSLVCGALQ